MISIYLQGLSLGLAYLAPIGMQNLFVINSASRQKFGRAIATALIVTFWDITLGLACFLGAGAIFQALPWLQSVVLGIGGLLVIYIGISLIRSQSDLSGGKDIDKPLWVVIGSAFVVTWLNPQALLDGTLMLGAFRTTLPAGADPYFIGGFTSASCLWFNGLAIAVHMLGSKFNDTVLTWINRICGAVIILYGLKLLYNFINLYIA